MRNIFGQMSCYRAQFDFIHINLDSFFGKQNISIHETSKESFKNQPILAS